MLVSDTRYDYRSEYTTRAYYVDAAGNSVHWRLYPPIPGQDVNEDSHHITFKDASYYYYNPDFSRYATNKCGQAVYIQTAGDQITGWVETKLCTGVGADRIVVSDRSHFNGDEERERVMGEFISGISGPKCGAFQEILGTPRPFPLKSFIKREQPPPCRAATCAL